MISRMHSICRQPLFTSAVLALSYLLAITGPAMADLKVCNNTKSRVGIAIGYKSSDSWASEGWWNLKPGSCERILKGDLNGRFYYVHAVDYDKGGAWSGKAYMCTRDKLFTIKGAGDCVKRGYRRSGFFEVDTGSETDWTVNLTGSESEKANTE
ncbi:MAG: hypothetical protein C0605_10200 [Hyphomicrobiales bacterium]|nr:MAG: hypothetical protein C0605_10200 [Hyphomicrobiales bacterium]